MGHYFNPTVPVEEVEKVLVNRSNFWQWAEHLEKLCSTDQFIGFDIETYQIPHDGLKKLMKMNEEGFSSGRKLIFDHKRTYLTGASFYFGNLDPNHCYYLDFGHADSDQHLPISWIIKLLDLTKEHKRTLIIHNAQYEISAFLGIFNYEITNYFCSMQFAVSCYGPDEYDPRLLKQALIQGVKPLRHEIARHFSGMQFGERLRPKQEEVLQKFVGKTSDAEYSYNGIVKNISWGYGLKKAVRMWFGYQMTEFDEVLGKEGKSYLYPHMGAVPAERVLSYGCDDAFWCYQLFMLLYRLYSKRQPEMIKSFFAQENPMCFVYAEACVGGMRVNFEEIRYIRDRSRVETANYLRQMKAIVREKLKQNPNPPFHTGIPDGWYNKAGVHDKYLNRIKNWVALPDDVSDLQVCLQVSCALSNAWADDLNLDDPELLKQSKPPFGYDAPSINHYMFKRVLLFVLFGLPFQIVDGSVSSDKAALAEIEGDHPILKVYSKLATIEQAMKLYNTPYLLMTDPEDHKMHPQMSCLLATRRTACSNPKHWALAA